MRKIDFLFLSYNLDLARMIVVDIIKVNFIEFFPQNPRVFFLLKHPSLFVVITSVKRVNFH